MKEKHDGELGQGKNRYNLSYILAKRADTSAAWINSIFLVMNLLILIRIFFALEKRGALDVCSALLHVMKRLIYMCSLSMPRISGQRSSVADAENRILTN